MMALFLDFLLCLIKWVAIPGGLGADDKSVYCLACLCELSVVAGPTMFCCALTEIALL